MAGVPVKHTVLPRCWLRRPCTGFLGQDSVKDYRRRGIGRELLRNILKEAERRGCYKLMVLSDVHRHGVVEFYKAAGFETGVKNGLVASAPFVK